MAKHTITEDQTTTYTITPSNSSWLFAKSSTISVDDLPALVVEGDGNTIEIFGRLQIGRDSLPSRQFAAAVMLNGTNSVLENHGVIQGREQMNGIMVNGDAEIRNYGLIRGRYAIEFSPDCSQLTIVNEKEGVINGNRSAIAPSSYLDSSAMEMHVTNLGLIEGIVSLGAGDDVFINKGRILNGIFELGHGNDVIDARGGVARSAIYVFGDFGNDVFLTDNSLDQFNGADGFDTVKSSASYTLVHGVEKLILLGGKDLKGVGSYGDNKIVGNRGDNIIIGGGGADTLMGGKGHDEFVFNTESDTYVITDFAEGVDQIHIKGFDRYQAFADIENKISQVGSDVVIYISKADHLSITIEDISRHDLTASDFQFN